MLLYLLIFYLITVTYHNETYSLKTRAEAKQVNSSIISTIKEYIGYHPNIILF